MTLHDWSGITAEQLNPLVSRKCIHTDRMTIARLYLKAGAVVPEHRHENEQVSTVVSGRLTFKLDGREIVVSAGESLQIPSNVPHSVVAEEDSEALDLFAPCREDWIRGDDAYLRSGAGVAR